MNRIYKYHLSLGPAVADTGLYTTTNKFGIWEHDVDLPEGASILSVKFVSGGLYFWASVNPDEHIITKYEFVTAYTGVDLPTWCNKSTHIGTVNSGPLIYHVFARTD